MQARVVCRSIVIAQSGSQFKSLHREGRYLCHRSPSKGIRAKGRAVLQASFRAAAAGRTQGEQGKQESQRHNTAYAARRKVGALLSSLNRREQSLLVNGRGAGADHSCRRPGRVECATSGAFGYTIRPNLSIERTVNSKLRLLSPAAHVKR